jgi:hypothetical protein
MTKQILNFIQHHNVRPIVFILIYVWAFLAADNSSIPCAILSVFHIVALLLISEND